jgi:hypothetical protein
MVRNKDLRTISVPIDWKAAKLKTEVIVPCVTAAGLLLGGSYTVFEYRQQQSEKRVATTMEYVSRFLSAPLSEHRAAASTAWQTYEPEILGVLMNAEKLDERERIEKYGATIIRMVNENSLAIPIQEELLYFEQLAQCVKLDLCDRDVARSMLYRPAKEFLNQYYPYVCALRKEWNDPTTAAGLEEFVRGETGKDACSSQ